MDRKALASAIAVLLVLVASGSASALTISSLGGLDSTSYQLTRGDLNLIGWSYDLVTTKSYSSGSSYRHPDGDQKVAPVPEPSAAIVFGVGLVAASQLARRKH